MAGTRSSSALEIDGLAPDEAFAVLGNEIRLDIIRALWEADAVHKYDDLSETAGAMTFSELRREVAVDDNGKFNYHLSHLVPHFVRRTEDGYRLSAAGKQISRTVIAVSGGENVDMSAEIDRPCPLCDSPMTATYEDQWLRIRCTECEGFFGDEMPDGGVFSSYLPAGGMTDRTANDAFATGFNRCILDVAFLMRDLCRECTGSISGSVTVCEEHEHQQGRPCSTCGTRFPVWAELRCVNCGFAKCLPIEPYVLTLTPVISFLDDQGIDALTPSFEEILHTLQTRCATSFTREPFRVAVTIEGEPGPLTVLLDADMNVVEVDHPRASDAELQ